MKEALKHDRGAEISPTFWEDGRGDQCDTFQQTVADSFELVQQEVHDDGRQTVVSTESPHSQRRHELDSLHEERIEVKKEKLGKSGWKKLSSSPGMNVEFPEHVKEIIKGHHNSADLLAHFAEHPDYLQATSRMSRDEAERYIAEHSTYVSERCDAEKAMSRPWHVQFGAR